MNTQQPRRLPEIKFRVLIIGRANAGKTSILQRVCETTESPSISQGGESVTLDPSMDRGEHTIDDELIFSNHMGYIFHDSRGVESGGTEELAILQEFIRRKCGEKRLKDKLHAIWYCIPMDNHRPELDLRFFNNICPDQNVPVVAVFTKYDQFRRNVKIDLDDYGSPDDIVSEVAEKRFREHYLHPLGDHVGFVRLEQMHRQNRRCDDLIETTAAALNENTIALMLLTVQKSNLTLSVKTALNRVHSGAGFEVEGAENTVRKCLFAFPYIWGSSFNPWYFTLSFLESILTPFKAVILILKHATLLRLSNLSPKSALTHAELDYRAANIDVDIQQYLMASSQDHSVELFAAFIMAIDICSAV
ncbi:hypothetical protein EDB84DRAFT_1575478 [Lactarius hengduanensis]|nr:hypothetical protein EDB84DRAFT_1575478 [Lactarius hengduanensis]